MANSLLTEAGARISGVLTFIDARLARFAQFPGSRPEPGLAPPVAGPSSWVASLDRRTRSLLLLAVLAATLKLACAWTTIGTNDVPSFKRFARCIVDQDLSSLYRHDVLFNHTPLVAGYITAIDSFSGKTLRPFSFWLRLPGILADLAVALLFISQRRRRLLAAVPDWALALFILSPVSFMVSGFHGNFDSVMVMFLVFSAWMCLEERVGASALFFALSMQVKVAPMVVLPVFFIFWLRRGMACRFTAIFLCGCLIGWIEPLTDDPAIFFHKVFGYNSYWGLWGVTYCLERTHLPVFTITPMGDLNLVKLAIIKTLKFGIVLSILVLAWSRRPFTNGKLLPVVAVAWSIFFVFAPGGAPQYLVWLAPFVLLFHARWYLVLTVGSTLFCFAFYQTINRHFPWYYGASHNMDIPVWAPWMLAAWVSTGGGLWLGYRQLRRPSNAVASPDAPAEGRELRQSGPALPAGKLLRDFVSTRS